ncbi:MAG TPA: hypothetical protein VF389_03370 [Woeseiaceae bacterium]
MKLRIQDNSVRLRLTRTEVDQLSDEGEVSASALFPGGSSLQYAVTSSPQAHTVEARFDPAGIVVVIPQAEVQAWARSEQVSITGSTKVSDKSSSNAALTILVEKDFACLKPREGEDESDMFPHPEEGKATC